MPTEKITEAHRTDWPTAISARLRSVPVFLNPGPFRSWICWHSAPQTATKSEEIILCKSCLAERNAGAYVAREGA
jgi:hypothetical protein